MSAARGADLAYAYAFPAALDVTGYTARLVVYASRGGATLLTVTSTPTANGSFAAFDGQRLEVHVEAADIDALPQASVPTEPSLLQYDLFLTSVDLTEKLAGGLFKVQPVGAAVCGCEGDIEVIVGGCDVSVELVGPRGANGVTVPVSVFMTTVLPSANGEEVREALGDDGYLSLGDVAVNASPSVNRVNYQAIAQRCADEGKTLWIPHGIGPIDGTIDVDGYFNIDGCGTLRANGINAPMIRMSFNGGGVIFAPTVKNVAFFNETTALNRNSAALEYVGEGTYALYPVFLNLASYGCYTLFRNKVGTFPGPFGNETYLNWGTVQSCRAYNHPLGENGRHLVHHTRGSGTGWTYRDCKGELDFPIGPYGAELVGVPAYVRIDGEPGDVAGDVIFDGHVTGLQAACISVDGGLNYRVNVSISTLTQIDARAELAVFYDPQPVFVFGANIRPSALGGGINIARGLPNDLRGSRLEGYGFHEATSGNFSNAFTADAHTVDVCRVTMAPNHSTVCTVHAEGLVGGVGRGQRRAVFSIRHDGTNVVVTEIAALGFVDPPAPGPSFLAFSTLIEDSRVTIKLSFTSSSGSDITWQFRGEGGACRYEEGGSTL
ncbi:hypothetical protein GCM10010983_52330 [Caulobacter rhizosphaerae]|nr:hypothetical protein GCM10010983_52330 [Caulobacter rhizosphaerae]